MYWVSPRFEKTLVILIAISYWVISFVFAHYLANVSVESQVDEIRDDVRREVALVRSKIEATVFEHTYIADSLATVIMLQPDFVMNNWERIAGALLKKSGYIRNVGMAPNNVISHVYPLEGNEKAIGLDFTTVPSQYRSVMKAKELGWVYLDGPLELVQGGEALIGRFPIFLDYPLNKAYWGSVSIVFRYQKILEKSGIHDLKNVDVALSHQSLSSPETRVFYGQASTVAGADFTLPIHLPNVNWQLSAQYRITSHTKIVQNRQLTWLLALLGAMTLFISMAALYRSYHVARDISLKDELTGLPNRRFFMSYLQQRAQNTKKRGGFTLLNVDLNKFKAVNDNFGHEAGDALLIHVADTLSGTLRSSDVIGRIGGDEFLVVLDRCTDSVRVKQIIQKIETVFSHQPLHWHEQDIVASLSIGYAICLQETVSTEALLLAADQAMYTAKKAEL